MHLLSFPFLHPSLHSQELIPELRALPHQGDEKNINPKLMNVLTASLTTLCKKVSWFNAHSPHQQFCWGVVATCSSKIPVSSERFDWIHSYVFVIRQLGKMFTTYCIARKLDPHCILSWHFPQEISTSASNDVIHYFQWVKDVQDLLIVWQENFQHNEVNYDDILTYGTHHASIDQLGQALWANKLVVDRQIVQNVKNLFIDHFDQLNSYLLRYIPGHPEAHWCTLPALLTYYGSSLPLHIQETISNHILFPGEQKPLVGQLLCSNIPVAGTGKFQPGHEISLKLTKALTLKKLKELLQGMASLQCILEHLDMLVFFHLQQSEIFKKYLLKHLEEATKPAATSLERSAVSPSFSLPFSLSYHLREPKQAQGPCVTLEMLEQALDCVHNLIHRLAVGIATYAEIVAGGALSLESLNIQRELEIFTQYARHTGMAHTEGLAGIQSMLELFQFTHHIYMIHRVCEQYQLKRCLTDPTLNQLMDIVNELCSEVNWSRLTLLDALKKV